MLTIPKPLQTRPVLILLAAMLPVIAAHAQSGYTMTRLAPPSGQQTPTSGTVLLDQQNRAYVSYYYKRMGFTMYTPPFLEWGEIVTQSPVQWSASGAASLTPSRLYSKEFAIQSVTPNGSRLFDDCSRYWDRKSNRVITVPKSDVVGADTFCTELTGNDAGVLVQSSYYGAGQPGGATYIAVAITANSVGRVLPTPPNMKNSTVFAINANGVMAGSSNNKSRFDTSSRAVMWAANDQPTVLPAPVVNEASEALLINDNANVLVASGTETFNLPESATPFRTGTSFHLWRAGAYQKIHPLPGYEVVDVQGINNKGDVVGTMAAPGDFKSSQFGTYIPNESKGRAFIWRDGVTRDLTEYVRSKGLALPANAIITRVTSLNNQGSLAIRLLDPAKMPQIVAMRLTAKP